VNLHKCLLTQNNCYIAGKTIVPEGIMVHSTGANNPNLRRYIGPDDGLLGPASGSNWNTAKPGGTSVCVHGFIGKLADGTIATYQTLPWNMRGWHAGGTANNTYIGFEICEDGLTDTSYFSTVYKEAVDLCAYLCKIFGLTEQNIICHSEGYSKGIASNHGDVMHWFPKHGKSMNTFRAAVKAALNEQEDNNMTQEKFDELMNGYLSGVASKEPGGWSAEERKWAESTGLVKGSADGEMQYQSFCTREQMVVFLYRLANQIKSV
jgi:hypothetical protein